VRKEYHVETGCGNVEVWKRNMRKVCTGGRNVRGERGKVDEGMYRAVGM
jgi:hypothetical protein